MGVTATQSENARASQNSRSGCQCAGFGTRLTAWLGPCWAPEIPKSWVPEYGASSPLVATYEDPTITEVGTDVLKCALEQARPRPVTPAYPLVSKAIFENVHDALTGRASARDALQAADRDIDRALALAARHGLEP
jgi:hypothetical protein